MCLLNLIFFKQPCSCKSLKQMRMSVADIVFAIFHCEEKISDVYAIDVKL